MRDEANALFQKVKAAVDENVGPSWVLCLQLLRADASARSVSLSHHGKGAVGDDIAKVLTPVFRQRSASRTVSVAVDIDPISML